MAKKNIGNLILKRNFIDCFVKSSCFLLCFVLGLNPFYSDLRNCLSYVQYRLAYRLNYDIVTVWNYAKLK